MPTCYFGNFENAWTSPSKIIVPICRKLSCLPECKKSTSSITCFLRYCKEIANLLFWVIWASLATHLKWYYELKKPLMFICGQKINFILHVFLKILQRYCKLVILGTLGIPGTHTQIVTNQFVEKFRLFGGKKSTSSPHVFLEILQRCNCKLVILGTLGIPGYAHPKWQYQLKVGLAPSEKISFYLLQWKPFRNDEKSFLFHLKCSFRSQDI